MNLLEELKRVHKKMQDPENWEANGFCMFMSDRHIFRTRLHSLFCTWPNFSGDLTFPVSIKGQPHPEYMWEHDPAVFWDRENSEYAALRWELLEFCIAQLETQVSTPPLDT